MELIQFKTIVGKVVKTKIGKGIFRYHTISEFYTTQHPYSGTVYVFNGKVLTIDEANLHITKQNSDYSVAFTSISDAEKYIKTVIPYSVFIDYMNTIGNSFYDTIQNTIKWLNKTTKHPTNEYILTKDIVLRKPISPTDISTNKVDTIVDAMSKLKSLECVPMETMFKEYDESTARRPPRIFEYRIGGRWMFVLDNRCLEPSDLPSVRLSSVFLDNYCNGSKMFAKKLIENIVKCEIQYPY